MQQLISVDLPELAVANEVSNLFAFTVRSTARSISGTVSAMSSFAAWSAAAELSGDVPCGITVTPA